MLDRTLDCFKNESPNSVKLKLAITYRTIYINCISPLLLEEDKVHPAHPNWSPPLFDHEKLPLKSSQHVVKQLTFQFLRLQLNLYMSPEVEEL